MSHVKQSFSRSMRGPYLPTLKGSALTHFLDFDRFFHLPWGHVFPPVNVKENAKAFQLELMVPGLDKKDFNISFDAEFLTVAAESKQEDETKDNSIQKEFGFSSFSRSFHLPLNANEDDIQAKYDGGVLRLTIAKKDITAVKPKKSIEVM